MVTTSSKSKPKSVATKVNSKRAASLASLTSSANETWRFSSRGLSNGHYFLTATDLRSFLEGDSDKVKLSPVHAEHGEEAINWKPSIYRDVETDKLWFGDGSCLLWFTFDAMPTLLEFAGITEADVARKFHRQASQAGLAAGAHFKLG